MNKEKINKDLNGILDIISGAKTLREKEEKIKEAKRRAINDEKDKRRKKIINKEVKLEKDPVQKRKVVQNIKVFEWSALDRYQPKFENKTFLIILILCLLFALFLAILGNYLLMAAIMSLLFLLYVAGITKPATVKHKITGRGIDTGGKLYEWYLLGSFFFSKKENKCFLIINTKLNFPKVLILLLNKKEKDALFVLLQEKLLYEDIREWKWWDRINYGEYIPLEKV